MSKKNLTTAAATKKVTTKVTCAERVNFLTALINEKKYTQKELCAKLNSVFVEHTKAANDTILVDSKNVLYCQFDKLVIVDKATKIMSFANLTAKEYEKMKNAAQAKKVADKKAKEEASKKAKKAS